VVSRNEVDLRLFKFVSKKYDKNIIQMEERKKQVKRLEEKDRKTYKIVVVLNRVIIVGLILFVLCHLKN
jgi:hypothetical protein